MTSASKLPERFVMAAGLRLQYARIFATSYVVGKASASPPRARPIAAALSSASSPLFAIANTPAIDTAIACNAAPTASSGKSSATPNVWNAAVAAPNALLSIKRSLAAFSASTATSIAPCHSIELTSSPVPSSRCPNSLKRSIGSSASLVAAYNFAGDISRRTCRPLSSSARFKTSTSMCVSASTAAGRSGTTRVMTVDFRVARCVDVDGRPARRGATPRASDAPASDMARARGGRASLSRARAVGRAVRHCPSRAGADK